MIINYRIGKTREGWTIVKEDKPFIFCCDKLKEKWDTEIQLLWGKDKPEAAINYISVTHSCAGYDCDTTGFDIEYCPFCGEKIQIRNLL